MTAKQLESLMNSTGQLLALTIGENPPLLTTSTPITMEDGWKCMTVTLHAVSNREGDDQEIRVTIDEDGNVTATQERHYGQDVVDGHLAGEGMSDWAPTTLDSFAL